VEAAAAGDRTRRVTSSGVAHAACIATFVALAACSGCGRGSPSSAASVDVRVALAPLHAFEESRRAAMDFAHAPRADAAFGDDPYDVKALGADRFVGILRGAGSDAIVVLDRDMRELQRLVAPPRR